MLPKETYDKIRADKSFLHLDHWAEMTREEMMRLYAQYHLSDGEIAELFGVSKGKVTYRRKKFHISQKDILYEEFMGSQSELRDRLNRDMKAQMDQWTIDQLAKAVTHYIFRNGPVEDMHAAGKLTQADMKTLNQYMVNKLATLLSLHRSGDYLKLVVLLSYFLHYGSDWDPAQINMKEEDELIKMKFM